MLWVQHLEILTDCPLHSKTEFTVCSNHWLLFLQKCPSFKCLIAHTIQRGPTPPLKHCLLRHKCLRGLTYSQDWEISSVGYGIIYQLTFLDWNFLPKVSDGGTMEFRTLNPQILNLKNGRCRKDSWPSLLPWSRS